VRATLSRLDYLETLFIRNGLLARFLNQQANHQRQWGSVDSRMLAKRIVVPAE